LDKPNTTGVQLQKQEVGVIGNSCDRVIANDRVLLFLKLTVEKMEITCASPLENTNVASNKSTRKMIARGREPFKNT